jgi:hypothetical protein
MQFQMIINHMKWFVDVFVGLLGSRNNIKLLHLFPIYYKFVNGDFFNE